MLKLRFYCRWIISLCLSVLILSGCSPSQAEQPKNKEKIVPIESITIEELKEHVYYLASDDLGGRVVGTPGFQKAARYTAQEFEEDGLEPGHVSANGKKGYLQAVPFKRRQPTDLGHLIIRTPERGIGFDGGIHFKFLVFKPDDFAQGPLPVVFVGYGIEEPQAGWNDYTGLDIKGKAAVMIPGSPKKEGRPVLPPDLDALYATGEGDGRRFDALYKREPAALLLLANPWRSQNWEQLSNALERKKVFYAGDLSSESDRIVLRRQRSSKMVIRESILKALFRAEAYSPLQLKEKGIAGYRTFNLKDVSIELKIGEDGEKFNSWNVVGLVRGTDPQLQHQYITVGAHLDHIPPRNGQICNGADDNASGSAGVLEIAEAVARSPFKRSVLFILYTAEETGLYGSRHFVRFCPVPITKILVNINLDMIGRTDLVQAETRSHYALYSERIAPEIINRIKAVNTDPVMWPLIYKELRTFPGGSDHISFMERSIPAVFFFSGHHADLHRPTDDADKIEYDKMQKISQLIYRLVEDYANRNTN